MPIANAETPAAGGDIAHPIGARAIPRWRDVRNYALQLASLGIFFGLGFGVTLLAPVLRVALGRERALACVVGEFHEEDHREQDQGGKQARDRGAASSPVEPDFFFVPSPDHPGSLAALTFVRNPKVPQILFS